MKNPIPIIAILLAVIAAGCISAGNTNQTTTLQTLQITKPAHTTTVTTIDYNLLLANYHSLLAGKKPPTAATLLGRTYYPAGAVLIGDDLSPTMVNVYIAGNTTYKIPLTKIGPTLTIASYRMILEGRTTIEGFIGLGATKITLENTTITTSAPLTDLPPQLWTLPKYRINNTTYALTSLPTALIVAEYTGSKFTLIVYPRGENTFTFITGEYTIEPTTPGTPAPHENPTVSFIPGLGVVATTVSSSTTTVVMPPELSPASGVILAIVKDQNPKSLSAVKLLLHPYTTLPPVTAMDAWGSLEVKISATLPHITSAMTGGAGLAAFYIEVIWALGGTPTLNIAGAGSTTVYFVQEGEVAFISAAFGYDYDILLSSLYFRYGPYTLTKITMPYGGQWMVNYTTVATAEPLPILYTGGALAVTETVYLEINPAATETITNTYTIINWTITFTNVSNGQTFTTIVTPGAPDYERYEPYFLEMKPLYSWGNAYYAPRLYDFIDVTAAAANGGGTIIGKVSPWNGTVRIVYTLRKLYIRPAQQGTR